MFKDKFNYFVLIVVLATAGFSVFSGYFSYAYIRGLFAVPSNLTEGRLNQGTDFYGTVDVHIFSRAFAYEDISAEKGYGYYLAEMENKYLIVRALIGSVTADTRISGMTVMPQSDVSKAAVVHLYLNGLSVDGGNQDHYLYPIMLDTEQTPGFRWRYFPYMFGIAFPVFVFSFILLLKGKNKKLLQAEAEPYAADDIQVNTQKENAGLLAMPYDVREPLSETSGTEVISSITLTDDFLKNLEPQEKNGFPNFLLTDDISDMELPPEEVSDWLLYSPKPKPPLM